MSHLKGEKMALPSITTTGMCLEETAIQQCRAGLRGQALRPGDDGYDAARKLYNAMIDCHPALIVRCTGVADVIRAVAFARGHDLLVAIRGGGHNVAGKAMCDGGLVIDLSPMKGVRVDPAARTARAEAGLTWGELDHETHRRWARQVWEAMQPYSTDAVYVNYLHDEGEARVRAVYGASYQRLVALKNTYDPTNFFRLNHNISPTV
jgi:FAD/FMN-containing dehydrogenase